MLSSSNVWIANAQFNLAPLLTFIKALKQYCVNKDTAQLRTTNDRFCTRASQNVRALDEGQGQGRVSERLASPQIAALLLVPVATRNSNNTW